MQKTRERKEYPREKKSRIAASAIAAFVLLHDEYRDWAQTQRAGLNGNSSVVGAIDDIAFGFSMEHGPDAAVKLLGRAIAASEANEKAQRMLKEIQKKYIGYRDGVFPCPSQEEPAMPSRPGTVVSTDTCPLPSSTECVSAPGKDSIHFELGFFRDIDPVTLTFLDYSSDEDQPKLVCATLKYMPKEMPPAQGEPASLLFHILFHIQSKTKVRDIKCKYINLGTFLELYKNRDSDVLNISVIQRQAKSEFLKSVDMRETDTEFLATNFSRQNNKPRSLLNRPDGP